MTSQIVYKIRLVLGGGLLWRVTIAITSEIDKVAPFETSLESENGKNSNNDEEFELEEIKIQFVGFYSDRQYMFETLH
ncbi:hypothetical protein BpHYR1_025761 [Brachionus plicatilis]|uniref:Uncharacterized protein n=1 Tax=Brachionus plicatilis TaxID=10195 RepID=A0A3M7RZH4_BRAPC|nr:hypothetical protein BpHYR1_025761 [Brachionus plicatilis]